MSETPMTGIARLTSELARRLARRSDLNVHFYAGEFLPECMYYAQTDTCLKERIINRPNLGRIVNAIIRNSAHFVERTKANRSLILRAIRSVLTRAPAPLRRTQSQLEDHLASRRFVYHSPFDAIPPGLRNNPSITKFVTIYDLTSRLFPAFSTKEIIRRLETVFQSLDQNTYCLCISEQTKRDLIAQCDVNPDRCFVTHLAASENFCPCESQSRINEIKQKYSIPAHYFLSISTLEPRKNIPTVIRAFATMLNKQPNAGISLVLVGARGWKFDEIFSQASSGTQLRDRIIFTGHIPDEDLSPIYSGALGFIYMSFYEGFGLPPLEAMQCGLPVIASNTSSLPEVVGEAGILLDPSDQRGLADAMMRLAYQESLRSELRQLGLNRAKLFTWEKCLDKTVAAYRKAYEANT